MPKYRSPNHNRLLALEQELLAKKRWAKELKNGQKINFLRKEQTKKVSQKRHTNNRLLQLERDILGKYHSKKFQLKTSQAETLRVEKNQSDKPNGMASQRIIVSKDKPQPRKSTANRIKSQVFDTGEPIVLQYSLSKPEVMTATTPQTAVVSVPEKTSMVETLSTSDLLISDEKLDVASVNNLPETPSPLETSEVPKIETSESELPVIPEKAVANSKISAETEQETEDSLSQAAELISNIDTQPYPLQAEDIPPIIAKLESDRSEVQETPEIPETPETPETPVTPPTKLESDRQNPHDIFDRLGKNMAYATTFDVGTIELEQLFDEFDDTLDREEKTDRDNAIAQEQSNLELEQRFNEFDRTLDREENITTATEQTPQTELPPEMLSEQMDIKIEPESQPESEETEETEETEEITSEPETDEIHDQNQPSLIAPSRSHLVEWLQSLSYDSELEPDTPPKLDVKLEALLFSTGIGLISLILRWLNLLRHQQIDIQPEIKSRSTLFPATDSDNNNNEEDNPNSPIIDLNQNNSTEEISPLIFPIERSPSLTKSTLVDVLTPKRDSLTGMPNYEFTEQNSYPSIDYPNLTTAENMNKPNKSHLDRKPCDPPQEARNDSS